MIRPDRCPLRPAASLVVVLAIAAPAVAGDPPAVLPSPAHPAPLAGPAVEDDASQGNEGMAEGKGGGRARPANDRRNMELWRRTFEELLPDLAPEVQSRARAAREAFEARMKEWRVTNGEKIAALERAVRDRMQGDGDGGKPDGAVLRQVRELRASAPKVEELQQAIWELLAPEQQERFKVRYDELKQEAARRAAGRRGPAQGAAPADPMQADPSLPGGGTPERHPSGKPFNFEGGRRPPERPAGGAPSAQLPPDTRTSS